MLALKEQQFVLAARTLGQSHTRILLRHLLPNLIGVIVVYLTLTIPAVILDESFLRTMTRIFFAVFDLLI